MIIYHIIVSTLLLNLMQSQIDSKATAAAFVAFLKQQQASGAIPEDQSDSIDFALDAITETFHVADSDVALFQGNNVATLPEIIQKGLATSPTGTTTTADSSAVPVHIDAPEVDEDVQSKADALKMEGNQAIRGQDYATAVAKYSQALDLIPDNIIYLSNRAAAYTSAKDYENAIVDATKASELDPTYAKAWSRLGLAKYATGDFQGSFDAYTKGLELEPSNETMKKGLQGAQSKLESDLMSAMSNDTPAGSSAGSDAAPGGFDFGSLASMLGGAGGAGGADGGLGGLGGLLNNPQLMQAASEMMKNPDAIKNMMQNPQVQNMARSMGLDSSGMDDMMNNPNLADMARNFMGGQNQ